MTDGTCSLELAHTSPGRLRLRWRGSPPPPALLEDLQQLPEVGGIEFRPHSRSLVVLHQNGLALERLQGFAAVHDVVVSQPEPPLPLKVQLEQHGRTDKPWAPLLADAEAVLLVGLMITWIRDLITSRTLKVATLLLLVLTALNLYHYWQQRRRAAEEEPLELEVLPA